MLINSFPEPCDVCSSYLSDFDSFFAQFTHSIRMIPPSLLITLQTGKICRHIISKKRTASQPVNVALNLAKWNKSQPAGFLQQMSEFVGDCEIRCARSRPRIQADHKIARFCIPVVVGIE